MLKQLNEAMAYIEEHLVQPMDMQKAARIAGCSEYHFRRLFSSLAGIPLGEYIRRRRMSLAANLLSSEKEKVIDVAFKLNYESPEAFSKAFRAIHGVNPSEVKKGDVVVKAFPPMTFKLTINGGIEMDYRIVEKEKFTIVGFKKRITMQFQGINPQMDPVIQKLTPDAVRELKELCNTDPKGMLNVSDNFSERMNEGAELDQYIGVATTKKAPAGYDMLSVPASVWAVFRVQGVFPDAVQDMWSRIFTEWLPTSGYELSKGPEILWNESPETAKPDYRSEIWIPVCKNSN